MTHGLWPTTAASLLTASLAYYWCSSSSSSQRSLAALWTAPPSSHSLPLAGVNSSYLQDAELLQKSSEKAIAERAEAAVLGAFLADAASAGYDG